KTVMRVTSPSAKVATNVGEPHNGSACFLVLGILLLPLVELVVVRAAAGVIVKQVGLGDVAGARAGAPNIFHSSTSPSSRRGRARCRPPRRSRSARVRRRRECPSAPTQ